MKISNSKKQLAKIISENGGWCEGGMFSAQDQDGEVFFYTKRPSRYESVWRYVGVIGGKFIECDEALPNWHQTILSRDEYFHLYPAPDADGWIEWKGGECPVDAESVVCYKMRGGGVFKRGEPAADVRWAHVDLGTDIIAYRLHKSEVKVEVENLTSCHLTVTDGTTIEQLAADYKAKLATAQKAQEEADSYRCGAESALERLVAAGKALGLVLSVAAPEPEPVITDWRDLQVGDVVEGRHYHRTVIGAVCEIDKECRDDRPFRIHEEGGSPWWVTSKEFKFIRRPAKGATNA